MILAESPYATQIRADITALRTLLMTLFFSAVGMLADPLWMVQNLHLLLPVVLAIIVAKASIIWLILTLVGRPSRTALTAGIVLAQVGEFSFVLASVAEEATLVGGDTFQLIISSTIITLFLTPFLIAGAPSIAGFVHRGKGTAPDSETFEGVHDHVIIVGYGPAGRAVADQLREESRPIVVLDMNQNTIRSATDDGYLAHFGDASNAAVLEHVHLDSAYAMIITIPDPGAARNIIHQAKAMSPKVFVMARARYHVHRWELEVAGAHVVVDEEQNVGKTLGVELVRHILGLDNDDLSFGGKP